MRGFVLPLRQDYKEVSMNVGAVNHVVLSKIFCVVLLKVMGLRLW